MIETICQYPSQVVMGSSAFIGAAIYAGNSIMQKKKELGNKFKFDLTQTLDTVWQSVGAGVIAGVAIGCSWSGIAVAMVTGVGVDKIANKFKIKDAQVLNLVQLLVKTITKKK